MSTKTITEAATKKLTEDKNVAVVREGKKIILPPGMSYADGREWLTRQEKAEESLVKIMSQIPCFPLDGIVALNRAMSETYGYVQAELKGFFGEKQPPIVVKIQTPDGIVDAVYGRISCPKWEGGHIMTGIDGASLMIQGEVKKKFEAEVNDIIKLAQKYLVESSIYRGQAIHMNLDWMDGSRNFDVFADSPKYMEIADARLILSKPVETALNTSVFMIIERSEACRANGIPLKHGAVLTGSFGTGKTMTAKVTAKKAVANGWTFIYLAAAEQLANGLRLAKMYAPAVVFAEDIDTAVAERDVEMNDILNTIDGVDTKDAPVITILTTNKVEDIEPAFLRAGRIDTVIHYLPPDAETAARFVKELGGSMLAKDVNIAKVGKALDGLVAAFIAEAMSKAKRLAIYRTGNPDITGQITTDDLLAAAEVVQQHAQMIKPREETPEKKLAAALELINSHGSDTLISKIGDTVSDAVNS